MENQLAYQFDDAQTADRFLNRLKSGTICGVRAKRFKGAVSILASYTIESDTGFDRTCQELDDLAASMGGSEISLT